MVKGNRKQRGGWGWSSLLPSWTPSTTEAASATAAPEASWWSPFSLFYSPKPSVVTNDTNTTSLSNDKTGGGKKHKKSVKKSKGKKHQKSAKR